ncbi:MAG: GHMP kinase [Methylococcaceae bacterium]|nr:MAG: GHMP kinase [Methylococcaceae bacterium]
MTDTKHSTLQAIDSQRRVRVTAPARLHMGFIDLDGSLGRRFGGVGAPLNEIATVVTLQAAPRLSAEGPDAERAAGYAEKLCAALGVADHLHICVLQAIPGHVGLGSGTQLALAVATAVNSLYGLDLNLADIVRLTGRGARSGIGIAAFQQGGLIVDGGCGADTVIPPVVVRLPMPAAWRFLLVFDESGTGLHGVSEVAAFQALPPFPAVLSAHLCHLLIMRGLPALVENDIGLFGSVITELQMTVGDHFAPAQGGRFTSPAVAEVLAWLERQGAVGMGQSSWGPTGFCLVDGAEPAAALLQAAQQRFAGRLGVRLMLATCRNNGAELVTLD